MTRIVWWVASVSIPVCAFFLGLSLGDRHGRSAICSAVKECDGGFESRFVQHGCVCVPTPAVQLRE